MKLGKDALEALRAEVAGFLTPGEELAVVGCIALRGTVMLAEQEEKTLRTYFSEGFLYQCRNLENEYGAGDIALAWETARREGATAMYAMGEGGILSALWKMAEAFGVGLRADLRRIPIRQETIEACERFDLNPYYLMSQGALLIGIPSGEKLVREYARTGIPAAVIGYTDAGNDRLLYSGEHVRYLDRPAQDEFYKMGERAVLMERRAKIPYGAPGSGSKKQ